MLTMNEPIPILISCCSCFCGMGPQFWDCWLRRLLILTGIPRLFGQFVAWQRDWEWSFLTHFPAVRVRSFAEVGQAGGVALPRIVLLIACEDSVWGLADVHVFAWPAVCTGSSSLFIALLIFLDLSYIHTIYAHTRIITEEWIYIYNMSEVGNIY